MIKKSFWSGEYEFINYIECSLPLLKEILSLRNDPDTRRWMTNSELIAEESHLKYIEFLRTSTDRVYFAVIDRGHLVASINLLKETDDTWEIGIFASSIIRGTGKTVDLELRFIEHLKELGVKNLRAKVKNNNERSMKHFQKVGYVQAKKDKEYTYYIYKINE